MAASAGGKFSIRKNAAKETIRPGAEPLCGRGSYAEIVIQRDMMTKEKIAEALEEIATLLELKDENPFKIRAYQNAARSIEAFGAGFSDLQNQETLEKIPGIGKAIAAKISELATTGELKFLDELRAEFPSAILELFSIPGLGAKKIKALYEKLKISSIADLQAACESGRVAELPGFGETTQTKICNAIANRAKHAGSFQFGEIAAEAEQLRSDLAAHPDASQVSVAGSFRRRKEIVRDLDFIVASKSPGHDHRIFLRTSLCRWFDRARPNEDERATKIGNSVRPARGHQCRVSFRAQLFYRQQGAQHRDAKPRAPSRLDAERIPTRAGAKPRTRQGRFIRIARDDT